MLWTQLTASLPAAAGLAAAETVHVFVEGHSPGHRASIVWLDDAEVRVTNSTS